MTVPVTTVPAVGSTGQTGRGAATALERPDRKPTSRVLPSEVDHPRHDSTAQQWRDTSAVVGRNSMPDCAERRGPGSASGAVVTPQVKL